MRRVGGLAFATGITLAGCGWALLIIAGPILRDMAVVKIGAGVMFSGFGICLAVVIGALWADVLGRRK